MKIIIIKITQAFDYILLTGDYPAHDVWSQSRDYNLAHAKTVVDYIKEFFPDVLVFPNLGNHEAFPVNRCVITKKQGIISL